MAQPCQCHCCYHYYCAEESHLPIPIESNHEALIITLPRTHITKHDIFPSLYSNSTLQSSPIDLYEPPSSRHVHFDVSSNPIYRLTQSDTPDNVLRKRLQPSPCTYHNRQQLTLPLPPSTNSPSSSFYPTIYLLTFSTLSHPPTHLPLLLTTHLPPRTPPIPHLYTLDCTSLAPPAPSLCAKYSGLSTLIQDAVLADSTAKKVVEKAVAELVEWACRLPPTTISIGHATGPPTRPAAGHPTHTVHTRHNKTKDGERERRREVAVSVCCTRGTHRSVAVAERIAQGVKRGVGRRGGRDGVKVVCRHVDRVRGWGDEF